MCYCEIVRSVRSSLMANPCKTRCWVSLAWEFHTGVLLTGTACSLHFILPGFALAFTKMLNNLFSRAAVTGLRKVSHSWPFRDEQSAHTFWRLLYSTISYWMHLLCLIPQKLWSTGKYVGALMWDMVLLKGCEHIMGILYPDLPAVPLWLQEKHPLHVIHILKTTLTSQGQVSSIGLKQGRGSVGRVERVGSLFSLFFFYLDREWQSIFFESIKIKNKLLSSFSQRGQISIAININRFSFKNLSKQETKVNKASFNRRFMHISIMISPR